MLDKLFRRQVPSISTGYHTRITRPHEGRQPGCLIIAAPEVIFRTTGVLHFEERFRTIIDRRIKVIGIIALSQIISHCSNVIAQGHYFTIIVAMVGSQCQENIRQHRHCSLFAGTSPVSISITAFRRKHIHCIFAVGKNLSIYLIYRITGNIRRFSRFKRLQAQRHPSVQTNQNIIIMCTQEISLTHATGLYLIGDRC